MKRPDIRQPISVRIRKDLLEAVQDKLIGPDGTRVHRGKMQSLIETLFIEWLHKQAQGNPRS